MDVLLNVALSDDHSGSPLSLGPGGSAQGSLLSPWHCLLSLWCFRFSPSPIHVSFCFHNLGDLPCKSVLHKRPCKIFTPSPWNFPSCPRQSTHLSLLLPFTFVCLPPPSLFFSAFTGSVGPLPSMAHILPPGPSSQICLNPQAISVLPSTIYVQLSPPLSLPN